MAKYTLYDVGEGLDAKNDSYLITVMRSRSIYFTGQTNREYMQGYADRAKILMGITLNYSSESEFVKSMIQHKLLAKGSDPSVVKQTSSK